MAVMASKAFIRRGSSVRASNSRKVAPPKPLESVKAMPMDMSALFSPCATLSVLPPEVCSKAQPVMPAMKPPPFLMKSTTAAPSSSDGDALHVQDDHVEVLELLGIECAFELLRLEALALQESGEVRVLHTDLGLFLVRHPVHGIHEQCTHASTAIEVAVVAEDHGASLAVSGGGGEREFRLASIRCGEDGKRQVAPDGRPGPERRASEWT